MTTMARTLFIIFILLINMLMPGHSHQFFRKFSKNSMKPKEDKGVVMKFYFHDIVSGENATAIQVGQKKPLINGFGALVMMDDPLTIRLHRGSKIIGRAQGLYESASSKGLGFLMVFNFVFTKGKFNGSSLSVLGRNAAMENVREMPIVGGTGKFHLLMDLLSLGLIVLIHSYWRCYCGI